MYEFLPLAPADLGIKLLPHIDPYLDPSKIFYVILFLKCYAYKFARTNLSVRIYAYETDEQMVKIIESSKMTKHGFPKPTKFLICFFGIDISKLQTF